MAVYRKKLVDKDGNTIIPAIGDIYGPVYTASLQSASGGIATYTFTPDTPVEANRVYAVKFPAPTVNNAVILLGDGNMVASSILLPPVVASDSPSYEIAYTTDINDTEVWLLMYNGSGQWVCLNQKKIIRSGDINWTNPSVTWTSGTYESGYKASSNTAFIQGIQACIYNGFLIVRFGVSKTSGSFAKNTGANIGTIPSTIDGVDISNLSTGAGSGGRQNLYRTIVFGSDGAMGSGQLNGNSISVNPAATTTWLAGQFIIPLNW